MQEQKPTKQVTIDFNTLPDTDTIAYIEALQLQQLGKNTPGKIKKSYGKNGRITIYTIEHNQEIIEITLVGSLEFLPDASGKNQYVMQNESGDKKNLAERGGMGKPYNQKAFYLQKSKNDNKYESKTNEQSSFPWMSKSNLPDNQESLTDDQITGLKKEQELFNKYYKSYLSYISLSDWALPLSVKEDENKNKKAYLFMRKVGTKDLLEVVTELDNNQSYKEAMPELLQELGRAFAHMHRIGIIHRDIKLDNIRVKMAYSYNSTQVFPVDFGYATETPDSLLPGTPGYISYSDYTYSHLDKSSDVYSLGITMMALMSPEFYYRYFDLNNSENIRYTHLYSSLFFLDRSKITSDYKTEMLNDLDQFFGKNSILSSIVYNYIFNLMLADDKTLRPSMEEVHSFFTAINSLCKTQNYTASQNERLELASKIEGHLPSVLEDEKTYIAYIQLQTELMQNQSSLIEGILAKENYANIKETINRFLQEIREKNQQQSYPSFEQLDNQSESSLPFSTTQKPSEQLEQKTPDSSAFPSSGTFNKQTTEEQVKSLLTELKVLEENDYHPTMLNRINTQEKKEKIIIDFNSQQNLTSDVLEKIWNLESSKEQLNSTYSSNLKKLMPGTYEIEGRDYQITQTLYFRGEGKEKRKIFAVDVENKLLKNFASVTNNNLTIGNQDKDSSSASDLFSSTLNELYSEENPENAQSKLSDSEHDEHSFSLTPASDQPQDSKKKEKDKNKEEKENKKLEEEKANQLQDGRIQAMLMACQMLEELKEKEKNPDKQRVLRNLQRKILDHIEKQKDKSEDEFENIDFSPEINGMLSGCYKFWQFSQKTEMRKTLKYIEDIANSFYLNAAVAISKVGTDHEKQYLSALIDSKSAGKITSGKIARKSFGHKKRLWQHIIKPNDNGKNVSIILSHSIIKNEDDSYSVIAHTKAEGTSKKIKRAISFKQNTDKTLAQAEGDEKHVIKISYFKNEITQAKFANDKSLWEQSIASEMAMTNKAYPDSETSVYFNENKTKAYVTAKKISGINLKQKFDREKEEVQVATSKYRHIVQGKSAEKLDIAVKAARAVEKLHKEGIIHRDLRDENFMYNPKTKKVWIVDFEFAHIKDNLMRPPAGDFSIRSPDENQSEKNDVYGLAVTLLYVLGFSLIDFKSYVDHYNGDKNTKEFLESKKAELLKILKEQFNAVFSDIPKSKYKDTRRKVKNNLNMLFSGALDNTEQSRQTIDEFITELQDIKNLVKENIKEKGKKKEKEEEKIDDTTPIRNKEIEPVSEAIAAIDVIASIKEIRASILSEETQWNIRFPTSDNKITDGAQEKILPKHAIDILDAIEDLRNFSKSCAANPALQAKRKNDIVEAKAWLTIKKINQILEDTDKKKITFFINSRSKGTTHAYQELKAKIAKLNFKNNEKFKGAAKLVKSYSKGTSQKYNPPAKKTRE